MGNGRKRARNANQTSPKKLKAFFSCSKVFTGTFPGPFFRLDFKHMDENFFIMMRNLQATAQGFTRIIPPSWIIAEISIITILILVGAFLFKQACPRSPRENEALGGMPREKSQGCDPRKSGRPKSLWDQSLCSFF